MSTLASRRQIVNRQIMEIPILMTVAFIIRDLQHAVSEVGRQDAVPEYGRGHERLQPSLPSGSTELLLLLLLSTEVQCL